MDRSLRDSVTKTIPNPLAGGCRNEFKKMLSKVDKHDGAMFGAIDSDIRKMNMCLENVADTVYGTYCKALKRLMEQETKVVEDPQASLDKEKFKGAQITINELDAVIKMMKHTQDRGIDLYCNFHGEMREYADELKDALPDLWMRMNQTLVACTRQEIGDGKPQLLKNPKIMTKVTDYLVIQQEIVHEIVQMRARMIRLSKENIELKEAALKK